MVNGSWNFRFGVCWLLFSLFISEMYCYLNQVSEWKVLSYAHFRVHIRTDWFTPWKKSIIIAKQYFLQITEHVKPKWSSNAAVNTISKKENRVIGHMCKTWMSGVLSCCIISSCEWIRQWFYPLFACLLCQLSASFFWLSLNQIVSRSWAETITNMT